jgi:DHA1 family multidrug resistance protein-like MFS transporter
MFKALKVNWTGTLLGIVAALLVPIPVIFWKYGAKIRERSAFAPTKPLGMVHAPTNPVVEEEPASSNGTSTTEAVAEKTNSKRNDDAV